MSRAIWKWPLEITDEQRLMVPAYTEPLCVQVQNGQLCLWAMIREDRTPRVPMLIRIYGTGRPMPDDPGIYIGTAQTNGGALVWHVFDRTFSTPDGKALEAR